MKQDTSQNVRLVVLGALQKKPGQLFSYHKIRQLVRIKTAVAIPDGLLHDVLNGLVLGGAIDAVRMVPDNPNDLEIRYKSKS